MEQYLLVHAAFLAGDAVSIANLPIACEPEQLRMLTDAEVHANLELLAIACMILAFMWAVEVDVAAITLSLTALSAARSWARTRSQQ